MRNTSVSSVNAFIQLSRPHTIIGTSLACVVLYVLAATSAGRHDAMLFVRVLAASLAVNIYIVSLNQITDVEIDRINKPYLPLAAGTLEASTVNFIVAITAALSLAIAASLGREFFTTIAVVFAIGSAYSAPPLRLKRFPVCAAASIAIARGLVGNLGVYITYSTHLSGSGAVPVHIGVFIVFMFLFAVVIALLKDIPDVDGDQKERINTLVIMIGPKRTLALCHAILSVCYFGSTAALYLLDGVGCCQCVLASCHFVALLLLWKRYGRVCADDKHSVTTFYMFIWKLFYFEFVAFMAASILA